MFNNLVNVHDISTVLTKIRQGQLEMIRCKLSIRSQDRVKAQWKSGKVLRVNWWDIPAVQQRWNRLVSGDPKIGYEKYIFNKYLASKEPPIRALSLGCGAGSRERKWTEIIGRSINIDACDLSETRIKSARETAAKKGYANINYIVSDVFDLEPKADYDLVLANMSLHHFSPLSEVLKRIDGFLKPDGYFVINEFVGPTRFQWTDRQLEITNGLLSILPDKYRRRYNVNFCKCKVHRPGRLLMMVHDPSEAIESYRIMPLLKELFEMVEIKGYGGTILHLLFSGIAQNFSPDDPEAERFLRLCFEVEDTLLDSGDIEHDFVVAVCGKKPFSH